MALSDDSARVASRSNFDSTLFLEAGAGTGKTEALVQRILGLIATGTATIDRIAAITFTVAAASELRERVRTSLERALGGDSGSRSANEIAVELGLPADTVEANFRVALAASDQATISTIHSFAQGILSTFPLQAGLPPGFRVLDPIEASVVFNERWSEFIDTLFDDEEHRPLLRAAVLLGIRTDHLEDLAREFHSNWDRARDLETHRVDSLPVPDAGDAVCALDNALRFMTDCSDAENDLLYAHLEELEDLRLLLEESTGDLLIDVVMEKKRSSSKIAIARGNKNNWSNPGGKAEVIEALSAAQDAFDEILTPLRRAVLANLVSLIRDFTLKGVEERRREGRLEFHDLVVHLRDLLRSDPQSLRRIREQFTHLLVDEFQDTDPLQVEICALIAAPDSDKPLTKAWQELGSKAGRLFFVGDPKQSIYRFRRADIAAYTEAEQTLGAGMTLNLTTNFRSHKSIVEWINAVFPAVFTLDESGAQAPYVALNASRTGEHPDGGSRVWILGGPASESAAGRAEIAGLEFGQIASAIHGIRDMGWKVDTRDPNAPGGVSAGRPARFGDIAVLVRGRASLPPLEAAFEAAGIPIRLESRSLVFDSQEARDLLALLTAIADSADDVAVVAALRSSAFGFSDDDLVDYRTRVRPSRDAWRPDAVPDAADDPVSMALRRLGAYRGLAWELGPSGLVEHVIADCSLLEKSLWSPRYRDSWRRIRFIADQCRAFVDAGGGGLADFIRWAQRQAEEPGGSGESLLSDPDDDAVRVSTIHGSKGLQYPIAIVAGISGKPRASTPRAIWHAANGPVFALGRLGDGLLSPGYEVARELELSLDAAELMRLMYVAASRAEDHLLVSLHHVPAGPNSGPASRSAAECIYAALPAPTELRHIEEFVSVADTGAENSSRALIDWDRAPALDAEAGEKERLVSAWHAEHAAEIATAAVTPMHAATRIPEVIGRDATNNVVAVTRTERTGATRDRELREPGHDGPGGSHPTPWKRGRAGTARGRAVHGVLQMIDLASGENVEQLAKEQAAAEDIGELAAEIAELVRSAIASATVQEAIRSGDYWREIFVGSMVTESGGIEGYIDLLYRTPEGLVVVDYKTDASGDPESLMQTYRYQGAAYAAALEKATGERVASVRFLFISTEGTEELEVDSTADLISEISAAI